MGHIAEIAHANTTSDGQHQPTVARHIATKLRETGISASNDTILNATDQLIRDGYLDQKKRWIRAYETPDTEPRPRR